MTVAAGMEERLFRLEFASGLLEVFVGVEMALIGFAWFADLVVLGAVAPALIVPLWIAVRGRFIAPRIGQVRFREKREQRNRRAMRRLVLLSTMTALLGVVVFLAQRDASTPIFARSLIAGLPAFLLALGALVAGGAFGLTRLFWYIPPLIAGGLAVLFTDIDIGWSLLGPGTLILAVGAVLLWQFFTDNPVLEEAS